MLSLSDRDLDTVKVSSPWDALSSVHGVEVHDDDTLPLAMSSSAICVR